VDKLENSNKFCIQKDFSDSNDTKISTGSKNNKFIKPLANKVQNKNKTLKNNNKSSQLSNINYKNKLNQNHNLELLKPKLTLSNPFFMSKKENYSDSIADKGSPDHNIRNKEWNYDSSMKLDLKEDDNLFNKSREKKIFSAYELYKDDNSTTANTFNSSGLFNTESSSFFGNGNISSSVLDSTSYHELFEADSLKDMNDIRFLKMLTMKRNSFDTVSNFTTKSNYMKIDCEKKAKDTNERRKSSIQSYEDYLN